MAGDWSGDVFAETVFDSDAKFVEVGKRAKEGAEPRFRQRYRIDRGKIYTETIAHVDADADSIIEALCGPWDWWRGGAYKNREQLSEGRVRYDLWPFGRFGRIHTAQTMYPPFLLAPSGWRLRIDVQDNANGVAYFDVRPAHTGCDLVGRYAGATIAGFFARLMGAKQFALRQLAAERTAAWPRLIARLES